MNTETRRILLDIIEKIQAESNQLTASAKGKDDLTKLPIISKSWGLDKAVIIIVNEMNEAEKCTSSE